VCILRLALNQDGPTLTADIDLNDFPDKVPTKWIADRCNRAQLHLQFAGISEFSSRGWKTDNIVDIEIERTSASITVSMSGPAGEIQLNCLAIHVDRIAGYLDGRLLT
jgi:hypothetical protein